MSKNEDNKDTKQRIINATLELMRETGKTSEISVRKIVNRAGIKGVGLINYHFGTRENLINKAVRYDTNKLISGWDEIYEKMTQPPIEKMKLMLKGTGDLVDVNPLFGRISIIHDILNPAIDDNTVHSIEKYMMIVREIYEGRKTEQEIKIITHILISAVQLSFLRADVTKDFLGFDYYDKEQRDTFIEKVIEIMFEK
ncbi:MAG: TetR/AcrR family transcriptional regulator [Promethearchaeota archaeon]|jgi:AcrR family transcriptional regulator